MCNFLQPYDPYYGWTSSFSDSTSSIFDWLLVETFRTLCSFEAEAFIGQSQAWWFSPPQYKHKSSLRRQSFSFSDSFLKLKESICIGSSFDLLVGVCFHGVMASALYSHCVKHYSYQRSNCLGNGFCQCQWIM